MDSIPRSWTTPKQVRAFLRATWPPPSDPSGYTAALGAERDTGQLGALLALLDALDPGVLAVGVRGHEITWWVTVVARLRFCVDVWRTGTEWAMRGVKLGVVTLPGAERHVLWVIDELLAKCPEQLPPAALPKLSFIPDAKLRENVARDIESLDTLFAQREWKAATVLGGSVVEALLLGAVEDKLIKGGSDSNAYATQKGWDPPEKWGLEQCIQAARELKLLTEDRDLSLVKACQGFRNLIHPGRERTTFPHDEGVAHGAVGAAKRLLALLGP